MSFSCDVTRGANVGGDLTTEHTSVEPAVPDVGKTPLDAVVPFRRDGEIVPPWEATLPGFLRSLFLSCSAGTCRTYLEALTRFIQEAGDPLETWLEEALNRGPRRHLEKFFPHIIGGHRLTIVGTVRRVTRPGIGLFRDDDPQ